MNPAKLQRLLQDGLTHHQAGRLAEAETLYRQARTAAPHLFDPLHLSGVLAYQQNRYTDALDLFARALKIDPKSALCEMRLGLALAALGRHREAEVRYRAALRRDPKLPEAWSNLGLTLRSLGQSGEAIACYQRAIALRPSFYEAHDRLGVIVSETQGLPAAIPHFQRAVELQSDYALGWCNLGLALVAAGRFPAASQAFERALSLQPHLNQARVGRALAYQQSYRLDEAYAEYGEALTRDPHHHEARSGRLLTLNYLSHRSRAEVFAEHLAFGRLFETQNHAPEIVAAPPPDPHKRLRVAFLSPDLRAHSVAYFIAPILQHLDRSVFEIFLYHDHFQVDAMSQHLRALADTWRNFVGQPGEAVANAIRADAPDILVDLAGHTGFNRLPLLARRLAPVQITYLGYPNTTGLRAMDYRLVDAVTDPDPADDTFHTEKLIRFAPTAWAYQPPAAAPEVAPPPSATAGVVTFGSFNNFAKVSTETLQLWRRVLHAVPGSRLVLKGHSLDDPTLAEVIHRRLAQLELAPDRIELLGRTPNLATHLACYARVDIALDSFPYHGTTTTCEALWMGVPVITLAGDRHAARVSASLLTAAGRTEWIARDPEHYVAIAVDLAQNPARLAHERQVLRAALQASPLLDHAAQAARFGAALRQAWTDRVGAAPSTASSEIPQAAGIFCRG